MQRILLLIISVLLPELIYSQWDFKQEWLYTKQNGSVGAFCLHPTDNILLIQNFNYNDNFSLLPKGFIKINTLTGLTLDSINVQLPPILNLEYTKDGKYIIVISEKADSLLILDANTMEYLYTLDNTKLYNYGYDNDKGIILALGNSSIRFISIEEKMQKKEVVFSTILPNASEIKITNAFTLPNRNVAMLYNGLDAELTGNAVSEVIILDTLNNIMYRDSAKSQEGFTFLSLSNDKNKLAYLSANADSIKILDVNAYEITNSFKAETQMLFMQFSVDDTYVLCGSVNYLKGCNLKKNRVETVYTGTWDHFIQSVSDSSIIYKRSSNKFLRKWNVTNTTSISEFESKEACISYNANSKSLTLDLDLYFPTEIELAVCDISGRSVSAIFKEHLEPGIHNLTLPVEYLNKGIYFVQIKLNGTTRGKYKFIAD